MYSIRLEKNHLLRSRSRVKFQQECISLWVLNYINGDPTRLSKITPLRLEAFFSPELLPPPTPRSLVGLPTAPALGREGVRHSGKVYDLTSIGRGMLSFNPWNALECSYRLSMMVDNVSHRPAELDDRSLRVGGGERIVLGEVYDDSICTWKVASLVGDDSRCELLYAEFRTSSGRVAGIVGGVEGGDAMPVGRGAVRGLSKIGT
jgi:hypothetical protein